MSRAVTAPHHASAGEVPNDNIHGLLTDCGVKVLWWRHADEAELTWDMGKPG